MEENNQAAPSSPWWMRVLVGRRPRRTLVRILVLSVTCFVVFKFVFRPISVKGISMEPTYRDGRINFVNRLAYRFHEPRRGDVICIPLAGESVMYLKRIVGLPGEIVSIKAGVLVIDGRPQAEPYVKYSQPWEIAERLLGTNEYFVVGDNRGMDQNDHVKGLVTRDHIVGKVLF